MTEYATLAADCLSRSLLQMDRREIPERQLNASPALRACARAKMPPAAAVSTVAALRPACLQAVLELHCPGLQLRQRESLKN
jgi:hypothetical protein